MKINEQLIKELVKEHQTPLFLLDSQIAIDNYLFLKKHLTNLDTAYYAMKSNSDRQLAKDLFESVNADFDIASVGELEILESIGVPASKIIYTHPYKTKEDIAHMISKGINTMVIDSEIELEKYIDFKDKANLLLRVGFRSDDATVQLAKKFGCPADTVGFILEKANNLGITISGISFHLGSQNIDVNSYVKTLQSCQVLFSEFKQLQTLNIGGGFPISYQEMLDHSAEKFLTTINQELAYFKEQGIKIIAEPGRFVSGEAGISISTVIGKSMQHTGVIRYYLDDGVYGSYSGKIYDGMSYPFFVIGKNNEPKKEKLKTSMIFGPTCDSIDIIYENIFIPELELGDLFVGYHMGSYTVASASHFNSVRHPKVINVKNYLKK